MGIVGDGSTAGVDNTSSTDAAVAAAEYANDYLGGLEGHVIKTDLCVTKNTPTGGTACGVQMVKDKVAAAIVPVLAQDGAVIAAMKSSGIPYISQTSANSAVLLDPTASVFTNPIGTIGALATVAKQKGVDHVALVIIDVPAATGPIMMIATPIFAAAKVKLNLVKVSPTVADMTPQLQQAIGAGAGMFAITGVESFDVTAIKGLKQLGFKGPIQASINNPSPESVASIPGGFEGIISVNTITSDAADKDVRTFDAVMAKYAKGTRADDSAQLGYAGVLNTLLAVKGSGASDAAAILKAIGSMAAPVPSIFGAGITFQCGAKEVPLTPAVCGAGVLQSVMDKDGVQHDYKPVPTS